MTISRRGLWLALVPLVVLAVVERWLVPGWLKSRGPMGPARWISAPIRAAAPDQEGEVKDTGYFLVRDFELAAGYEKALLKVAGDEEFWVDLNGTAVAAGERRSRPRLVVTEVEPYLVAGVNRLVVELRSPRPAGGLLLSLEIGGAEPRRIVTDESWSMVRRHVPELREPGAALPTAVPVRVWGPPPTGRWGWPREEARQPPLTELLVPGAMRPAVRARVGDPAGTWFRLPPRPEQAAPLGHWVTFDFGEEQSGLLNVAFRNRRPVRGLVFVGPTPPDPRAESPAAVLLKVGGLNSWVRVRPDRFRYVTVIADTKAVGARVYPVAPQRAARLLAAVPREAGVFGLQMPLRTTVEDEIWRDVERLARRGAR